MTDINQIKKILADAPEGATHVALGLNLYIKYHIDMNGNSTYIWENKKGSEITKPMFFHDYCSLADMRTIVEQAKRIAELEGDIEALKKHIDSSLAKQIATLSSNEEVIYNRKLKKYEKVGVV